MLPFSKNKLVTTLNKVIAKAITLGSIVGTSVIVAKDGQIIFEGHAGFANREKEADGGAIINSKLIDKALLV